MHPLIWLAGGGVLLLLELLFPSVDGFLIGGVAALLLSAVAALLPLAAALQLALFSLLFLGGYAGLRRWSLRGRPTLDALSEPGSERAEVIQPFDERGRGRVRWQGQSWAAELLETDGGPGPRAGEEVTVLRREGTRLQVLAALSRRTSG
ncbi:MULTISPECIES: NfeD family protein [unclassified Synechococcus]|uniref:NfeD family protein n=1 Tax=unclassified Synechococcus TaxID=2626047 RepID=UPI0002FEFE1A|nr:MULTISPECIES: NfeD family protein [unclassified Synechococcus]WFN58641.1 NfeD family protein [Synechococcus sp. CCFWC 502]